MRKQTEAAKVANLPTNRQRTPLDTAASAWDDQPRHTRVALCNLAQCFGRADTPGCDLTPDEICKLAAAAYFLSWFQAEQLLKMAQQMAPFADKGASMDYTIRVPV